MATVFEELARAGRNARKLLVEEKLAHVVYGYITKENPNETHLLEWRPVKFKTDKEFEAYLKLAEPEAAMIYAVHA